MIDQLTDISFMTHRTSEFLVHAADVEGLCQGIDQDLVKSERIHSPLPSSILNVNPELGEWVSIPTTYAGGAKGMIVTVPDDI